MTESCEIARPVFLTRRYTSFLPFSEKNLFITPISSHQSRAVFCPRRIFSQSCLSRANKRQEYSPHRRSHHDRLDSTYTRKASQKSRSKRNSRIFSHQRNGPLKRRKIKNLRKRGETVYCRIIFLCPKPSISSESPRTTSAMLIFHLRRTPSLSSLV